MFYILTEENSQLRGKQFPLPDGVKKHLATTLNNYKGDKTIDGYKRLNNLVNSETISYEELKRIKNFFDNYIGTNKSADFILNGGEPFKSWVNTTLATATKSIEDFKQAKKDAGISNAFIKSHEKNRQTKTSTPSVAKVASKNVARKIGDNAGIKYENKQKRICVITEQQAEEILKEAQLDSFSIKTLSSLSDFDSRWRYCVKECGDPIGKGSSRVVFQLSDEKVLKLAIDEKGVAQNWEERSRYSESSIFPEIYDIDINGLWLISEFVLQATEDDFETCMDIDFNIFRRFVCASYYNATGKTLSYTCTPLNEEEYVDLIETNEDIAEFDNFIQNYSGDGAGDMLELDNFGLAKRYGGSIVLLDSGLSEKILDKYYRV